MIKTVTGADLSCLDEANVLVVCCPGSFMREGPCSTSFRVISGSDYGSTNVVKSSFGVS